MPRSPWTENGFLKVAQSSRDPSTCPGRQSLCEEHALFSGQRAVILYIVFTFGAAVLIEAADISQSTGLGRKPAFVYCRGALEKLNSYWELNGNL